MDKMREVEQDPNMPSSHIATVLDLHGPNMNCLTACAASTQAIGEATEIIRHGDADVMLAGGCHSMLHPFGITGFNRLTALSTRNDDPKTSSRPLQSDARRFRRRRRRGRNHPRNRRARQGARGRKSWLRLRGFGSSADAYRITDIHESGRGGIAAMRGAIEQAQVELSEIDYISAHGTGTVENDRIETIAIKTAFGDLAPKIPVSSIKSMLGHLIAAAGGGRGHYVRAGHSRSDRPADDQLHRPRSGVRSGLRSQPGQENPRKDVPEQFVRFRRTERLYRYPGLRGLTCDPA